MDKVELVIKIDKDIYEARQHWVANPKRMVDEVDIAIANGTPLPKGHFIAICESDYPITEKVENILKETVFVGGDEEEEDMYCFDIKEIIEADKN